jgi:hypothetical protein
LRRGFAGVTVPEAGYVSVGMRSLQNVAEHRDTATVVRLRIKQLLHEGQMVAKVVTIDELVRGEKPDPGTAAQRPGVRPGEEFLALLMGARRLDRQDRRDFRRI